jgi:hypothetical protein
LEELPGKTTGPRKQKKNLKNEPQTLTYIVPNLPWSQNYNQIIHAKTTELQKCNEEESSGGSTENSEGSRRRRRRRGLLGG